MKREDLKITSSVKILLTALLILVVGQVNAQIFIIETGTITTCTGVFGDDGNDPLGVTNNPYTAGNDYTFTICPDNPGDVISVEFAAFSLYTSPNPQNSDYLSIFDGDNTSANTLGDYTGTALQGLPVTGTVNNVTGCLTFVFNSNPNGPGLAPGWEANILCTTPCAPPTAASEIVSPAPQGDIQSIGVCLDAPITFGDIGSFAEPTFNLQYWVWNFDDGTIDSLTTSADVTHVFTEPGEYLVTLSVIDNNGCRSLNIDPLQVLVSTIPIFNTNFNSPVCLNTPNPIDGSPIQNVTWTALPPQVVSGTTYLADGAGFQYSSTLTFDFFEPGATLENCSDLDEIYVNIEHSYTGDLGMTITCPNGTVVSLLDWPNGGGGTFLGSAIDDGSQDPGVGATYGWTPENMNGNLSNGPEMPVGGGGLTNGNSIVPGTYQSDNDMCALVGCPLNGDWSFGVSDNLAIDNGYIFFWGIDFNPSLFPDITTFTPVTGLNLDSSFWTGPNIIDVSPDGNLITTIYTTPGLYDYTFTATNNFGCTFDTTITVEAIEGPAITAGPDLLTCGEPVQLQAGLAGETTPTCAASSGTFDFCYDNNDNIVVTYCPDTPGDGTFMTLDVLSGTVEAFADDFTIFDGNSTAAPVLFSYFFGALAGTSVVATGPTGCLTLQINTNGGFSCADGSLEEIVISVSCTTGNNDLIWQWSPPTGLSNANVQNPTALVSQATQYTVTAYPPGLPGCLIIDQVIVAPDPTADPGLDTDTVLCYNAPISALISYMNGAPALGGTWTDETGTPVASTINPSNYPDGQTFNYTYTVGNNICTNSANLNLTILPSTDASCCQTNAQVGPDKIACGLTWQLSALPALGLGVWSGPPEVTFSDVNDPNAVATCESPGGAMTLTWTDFNGFLCEGSDDLVVNFSDPLQLLVVTEDALCNDECSGAAIAIPDGGTTNGAGYIYDWYLNGVPGIIPQVRDSLCAGTYYAKVFDQLGCVDSMAYSINQPNPQSLLVTKELPRCFEECNGRLIVSSLGATTYSFDGGDTYSASNIGIVCAGAHEVIARNDNGCEIDELVILPDPEEYVANFNINPNPTTTKNTTITFQDVSFPGPVGNSLFIFGKSPVIGESEDRISTFTFPRDTSGNYPVLLITENLNGCRDTLTKIVEIRDDLLWYIPNSFSPNEDGINDIWHPVGNTLDLESYSVVILDRWGKEVFASTDYTKGWNGSINGGEYYVIPDVYTYLIKVTSATTKDKYELTGSIMVVR